MDRPAPLRRLAEHNLPYLCPLKPSSNPERKYLSFTCGGCMYFGYFSGHASVFYGYCSQYYFLHKYNTKLYNREKEME